METCEIRERHWDVRRQSTKLRVNNPPLMFREGWISPFEMQAFQLLFFFSRIISWKWWINCSRERSWWVKDRDTSVSANKGEWRITVTIVAEFSIFSLLLISKCSKINSQRWFLLIFYKLQPFIKEKKFKLIENPQQMWNLLTNFSWCLKWWSCKVCC